jgi:alpha,alpha-trehalase
MADIDGIFYAGSHGFDIEGPEGTHKDLPEARELLPELEEAEKQVRERLSEVKEVRFEPKRFSLAVHYRQVQDADVQEVRDALQQAVAEHPGLRVSSGKKVYELQPDIEWDKGKALLWLFDTLQLDAQSIMPLYIGDDTTDEDAFAVLKDTGTGILVSDSPQETQARYVLRDPEEVRQFLEILTEMVRGDTHE